MSKSYKGKSLRSIVAHWMVFVVITQGLLLVAAIFAFNMPQKITTNEILQFEKSVDTGKTRIEEFMLLASTSANDNIANVQSGFDFSGESPVLADNSNISDTLIAILSKSDISGAFVMYNSNGNTALNGQKSKPCFYLRKDLSGEKSIGTAFELVRGSGKLVEGKFIPKSRYWQQEQSFENAGQGFNSDFFNKPISAVSSMTLTNPSQFSFWSTPFKLSDDDYTIVTYTLPLVDKNNNVFGVLGVEISAEAFENNFKYYSSLSKTDYSIALSVNDGNVEKLSFLNKSSFQDKLNVNNFFSNFNRNNLFANTSTHNIIIDSYKFTNNLVGYKTKLNLYNQNEHFSSESWNIYCLVKKSQVLSLLVDTAIYLLLSLSVALIAGIIISLMLGYIIVKPITGLSNNLKAINPENTLIKLNKTKYKEIDELSQSIELLSSDVANISSRMSKIISLVNLPLGAFEIKSDCKHVYITDSLFALLGIRRGEKNSNFVDIFLWNKFIENTMQNKHPTVSDVYNIGFQTGANEQWVRIKSYDENHLTFGIVMDVTDQIKQMDKLQYERDYDVLTNLLNRCGFKENALNIIMQYNDKVNALIMFDLDNLKSINDTFGHDWGDRYIKFTGEMLSAFTEHNSIVARMSGDEFYVLLYGYDTKQQILDVVNNVYDYIKMQTIMLPDETIVHFQASGGIAFYPYDAQNLDDLLKCADSAMYEIKNTTKGRMQVYSEQKFIEKPYANFKKQQYNTLEKAEFCFMFQPIADALTCKLYGYDISVRSDDGNSISEILSLAQTNGSLATFETTVHSSAIQFLTQNYNKLNGVKLFINAITSNIIGKAYDIIEPENKVKYLSVLVFTLTEIYNFAKDDIKALSQFCEDNSISINVDAFDKSYSEFTKLSIKPDYIKIDLSLLRDIENDKKNQAIFKNVTNLAHSISTKVIATEIESFDELQTVINLGADYLQGHLIGLPSDNLQPLSQQLISLLHKLNEI